MACSSLLMTLLCVVAVSCLTSPEEEGLFINEWAVKVAGGERIAREVAADHGFEFDGQIGSLEDTYAFVKKRMSTRSRRAADNYNKLLTEDTRVSWMEQQTLIVHEKKRADDIVPPDETGDDWAIPFNDPLWDKQWYLYNDGQKDATPGLDMNLMPAWKLGYTGKGVVVTIVDDGVDQHHPDLKDNFDKYASFDFNDKENGHSPTPDYKKPAHEVRHGTRCAGEVAAAANNSICGVGVAYEASIGGIRLLDGKTTDRLSSEALQFNNSHVDIYSCCWGPLDDGIRFEKPHTLTGEALASGAKNGRNGKGSIFVWAAGNGGRNGDHCGADGYIGDIHTIAISAINDHGMATYFTESCPAIMAVTLSGGPASQGEIRNKQFNWNLVTTTDLYGNCTVAFVGTSSSAPLASGLFAVVLQSNPQLTWRDLQYLITEGSKIPQPYNSGWSINGAGLHVHHDFGFGVLDAGKMVELALAWDLVGPQEICNVDAIFPGMTVRQGHSKNVTLTVNCPNVRSMEHVKAHVSLQAHRRGDVSFVLYSPFGTPSRLLGTREHDGHTDGLNDWPFMTVHNWGEDPNGEWTLQLSYLKTPDSVEDPADAVLELFPRLDAKKATLSMWRMTIYGLSEPRNRPVVEESAGGSKDAVGGGNGEGGEEEKNPTVNLDDAGKSDQDTIRKIYNKEQLASEEININLGDIANGVPLPPNRDHNINRITGEIGTGYFDGTLLTNAGLIRLALFARRLQDGDPILRYLETLDDESLRMLGRDFELDKVMEEMLEEDDRGMGGLMDDGERGFATEEEITAEQLDGRGDEITNTALFGLLRSLDTTTLQLLGRFVEEMENRDMRQRAESQSGQVHYQKRVENSLLGYTDRREEEMEEELEEKGDEEIQFQKRIDDVALLGGLNDDLETIEKAEPIQKKDNLLPESKSFTENERKKLYELVRALEILMEEE